MLRAHAKAGDRHLPEVKNSTIDGAGKGLFIPMQGQYQIQSKLDGKNSMFKHLTTDIPPYNFVSLYYADAFAEGKAEIERVREKLGHEREVGNEYGLSAFATQDPTLPAAGWLNDKSASILKDRIEQIRQTSKKLPCPINKAAVMDKCRQIAEVFGEHSETALEATDGTFAFNKDYGYHAFYNTKKLSSGQEVFVPYSGDGAYWLENEFDPKNLLSNIKQDDVSLALQRNKWFRKCGKEVPEDAAELCMS